VQRANQLSQAYRVESTPTFTVGGKYLTSPGMTNSYEGTLQEVDKLIPMARK
jgi:thiol:disulfide interchange protein DsbA